MLTEQALKKLKKIKSWVKQQETGHILICVKRVTAY